jgi:hypothetical protein
MGDLPGAERQAKHTLMGYFEPGAVCAISHDRSAAIQPEGLEAHVVPASQGSAGQADHLQYGDARLPVMNARMPLPASPAGRLQQNTDRMHYRDYSVAIETLEYKRRHAINVQAEARWVTGWLNAGTVLEI